MFDISQIPAVPVYATGDKLQMAPYNVRAMARFVNIHKRGLREQAQQNEKMHLELVKYIDTSKTQGFNDLQEAKLELVKHIDTWTNGYSDLLLEQLNSVSAERNVLSTRNAEITASLEVERELKRSKTEAFDRQGVELERVKTEMECVKQENYDLSKTKSELTGSLELKTEAFDKQGVELERVKKENYDLSNTKSELTGSLELKTEAFDKQGVELERVKKENYDLSNTKSGLIGEADQLRAANELLTNENARLHEETKKLDRMRDDVRSTLQYNNDYADEVSRKNEVISQLQHQVSELNRDNKQLENEKASLYQLQQKRNRDDSPPRRFSVPKPGQW